MDGLTGGVPWSKPVCARIVMADQRVNWPEKTGSGPVLGGNYIY